MRQHFFYQSTDMPWPLACGADSYVILMKAEVKTRGVNKAVGRIRISVTRIWKASLLVSLICTQTTVYVLISYFVLWPTMRQYDSWYGHVSSALEGISLRSL
jgi:hypothetical protein